MTEGTYYFASFDLLSTGTLQRKTPENAQTLHNALRGIVGYELDAVIDDSTTTQRLANGILL